MSYEAAVEHLMGLGIDAMKSKSPTMSRIEALCAALDNPQQGIPAIHVTGTNGKTSTVRIAASVLAATGLKVGTYTSPHLQSIRERITLNGELIDPAVFGETFDHMKPYLDHVEAELGEQLSFFEVLTGLFFLWAAEAALDALVVEVGLGGRWDATNVLPSDVAVITNVGLDHTGLLGTDVATIAKEKAGIIKSGGRVVTAARDPNVLSVISEEAAGVGASVSSIDDGFRILENRVAFGGRYLSVGLTAREYKGLFLPLHGSHQGVNAGTALEAATKFFAEGSILEEVIIEGLAATSVPGRLERLQNDQGPTVILDVAHNPEGMSALVSALVEEFAFENTVFVLGILADKDYLGMLSEIARVPCELIVTQAASVRSVPAEDLARAAQELGLSCRPVGAVADAVKLALKSGDGDLVCVTGSHYVVGEASDVLIGRPDA